MVNNQQFFFNSPVISGNIWGLTFRKFFKRKKRSTILRSTQDIELRFKFLCDSILVFVRKNIIELILSFGIIENRDHGCLR